MAIKMPNKKEATNTEDAAQQWINQGKNADDKAEKKPDRKQISVYLNVETIQKIKVHCALNNIKLNDFYEAALLDKLEKDQ